MAVTHENKTELVLTHSDCTNPASATFVEINNDKQPVSPSTNSYIKSHKEPNAAQSPTATGPHPSGRLRPARVKPALPQS